MDALTEQETALYDRQIRVWGVQTQRRLSKSRVLVVGMSGVTEEVCKNLVLAGIGTLGIVDGRQVSSLSAQLPSFLVSSEDRKKNADASVASVCASALKEFNPMVQVSSIEGDWQTSVENFDAIILNAPSITLKKEVSGLCRKSDHKIALYIVQCIGFRGEIYVDLQDHSYAAKAGDDELKKIFPSYEDVISVRWSSLPKRVSKLYFGMRVLEEFELGIGREAGTEHLQELLAFRNIMSDKQGLAASSIPDKLLEELLASRREEFPPVCAILGGILGQEMVKALSCRGEPLRNFFYFDTTDGKGVIEDLGCF